MSATSDTIFPFPCQIDARIFHRFVTVRKSTISLASALCVLSLLPGIPLESRVQAEDTAAANPHALEATLQSDGRGPGWRIPATTRHARDLTPEQVQARAEEARNQSALLKEKVAGQWFAALITPNGSSPLSIVSRFRNWRELADFVRTNQALVEVWADGGAGQKNGTRRLTPAELAARQRGEVAQPTVITLTTKDTTSGQPRVHRLELGFDASSRAGAELQQQVGADDGDPSLQPIIAALRLQGAGGVAGTETSLPDGGIIELVQGSGSGAQTYPGVQALAARHTQVLSDLLEWRHYLRKKKLGLPQETNELLRAASALEDLAGKGIWIDDTDALLSVDAFNNRFAYRRYAQGQPQVVTVTAIPSRADRISDVANAEAARRLEARERGALAPGGNGIALVHRVRDVNGRPEIGPLVFSDDSAEGIASLLALLDRLPVAEQARLRFDGFSGAIVDADFDGKGRNDRFFLTVRYPPGQVIQRKRVNPLTGEVEIRHERDGLLLRLVTDAWITDYDYNSDREETATRTCANTGSRNAPVKGPLVEETRTAESWQRDLGLADVDPYRPTMARSRVSHITGETTREIYGLFPAPVATVDEQFITSRQFNPYGVFVSATIFDNGRTAEDFARPLPAKLNEPIVGRERFLETSSVPSRELGQLRNLKPQGYLTTVLRRDLARGDTVTQTFDNGHWGRKVRESYADRLGGTNGLPVEVTLDYRDASWFGVISTRATHRSAVSGKKIRQMDTRSYDPFLKRLWAVELDATGRSVTNVWDYGKPWPIESQTAGRKTVYDYNRDATEFRAVTTVAGSDEELSRASGRFDTNAQHWLVQRVMWWRPGITNESQFLTLSSAGRVLSLRLSDVFERRPVYDVDGLALAVNVYRKHEGSGQFLVLHQQEDDFRWNGGERDARIQTYVEGQLYDSFRRVSDTEGRIVVDKIRQVAGLDLKTTITYDGSTERRQIGQSLQNGQVRWTRVWQPEERQLNGEFQLPAKIVPTWGLSMTETFRPGDPLQRPIALRLENDDTYRVTEWYEGTDIARTIERRNRRGRLLERCSRRLNAGTDRMVPYDRVKVEKLTFWGAVLSVETNAFMRGTDRLLFTLRRAEKVYADLAQPFDAPGYAVDPDSREGIQLLVRGERRDYLMKLFRSRIESGVEPLLAIDTIDVAQGVPGQMTRQVRDRDEGLLDEHWFSLPAVGAIVGNDQTLWDLAARAARSQSV